MHCKIKRQATSGIRGKFGMRGALVEHLPGSNQLFSIMHGDSTIDPAS